MPDGPHEFDSYPLDSGGQSVPVVLHSREGNVLYVRAPDPWETVTPIPYDPQHDEIVAMISVHSGAVFASGEVGAEDRKTGWIRVVYDGQEGDSVFVRTLRPGEIDHGGRTHVKPGQVVIPRPDSFLIELEVLDEQFVAGVDGYAPLANTIWTWFSMGGSEDDRPRMLYVIAASRRLDAAAAAWARVSSGLAQVSEEAVTSFNPDVRAALFMVVSDVELAVIAVRRVIHMIEQSGAKIGVSVPVPDKVATSSGAVKAIRDAFEHIDERAFGRAGRSTPPEATSVFAQSRLLTDRVVSYGSHELPVDEVPALLAACRQYLKDAAAELHGSGVITPRGQP